MTTVSDFVTITPLGGLGEIGLNCMTLTTPGGMAVIDCGLMFPDDYHLGVDVIIPRFDHILANKDKVRGIVLTHGHEDHIGALPWLLPHLQVPVYGSPFTLALVEHKLRERDLLGKIPLIPALPGQPVTLGDMTFHFFPVCHSIIDGYAIGVETPGGRIVHTGDFKIDPEPLDGGPGTDLALFSEFAGKDGVKLLMADSTNVEREGSSLTERQVFEALRRFFLDCDGRIIVTLFSSHIQRIQEVFDCAAETGRKVAVTGRSLINNIGMACDLGKLRPPPELYLDPGALPNVPDSEVVLLVTGSQGEPLSALSRIARGAHRHLSIKQGDTVIMSSRLIPGNTTAVTRLINTLYRQGAEVYYEKVHAMHASGHAHREELKAMIEAVRPNFFVPIHGEYRHLVKHCRLARECGVSHERAILLEDGQPLTLLPDSIRFEEAIEAESILVDGKGVGDVGQAVLKERHLLGGEGLVVVVMVLDEVSWEVLQGPEILSKGFVFEQQFSHVLEDAKCIVLDILESTGPGDVEKLQERTRSGLRRFFRKILERDPVVIPAITAI